jgi:hypothetical protein
MNTKKNTMMFIMAFYDFYQDLLPINNLFSEINFQKQL